MLFLSELRKLQDDEHWYKTCEYNISEQRAAETLFQSKWSYLPTYPFS